MDDDAPHHPGTRISIAVVRPVVATVVSRIAVTVADAVGRAVAIAIAIAGIGVHVPIGRIAITVIAWVAPGSTCDSCACEGANRESSQSPAPASPLSLCLTWRRDSGHCQPSGEHQCCNRSSGMTVRRGSIARREKPDGCIRDELAAGSDRMIGMFRRPSGYPSKAVLDPRA